MFSKSKKAHNPKHMAPKPDPEPGWFEVASFSGMSSAKSESFEIYKERFRFLWHVSGKRPMMFKATLRHHGEEIHEHELVRTNTKDSGTTLVNESGDLYLDIIAHNVNWWIKIEQEEQ